MREFFRGWRLREIQRGTGRFAICFTLVCIAMIEAAEPGDRLLLDLPKPFEPNQNGFKVDPYIAAAAELQALGKDRAISILEKTASEPTLSEVVIILCRMLFVARPRQNFRRPLLGGPSLLGLSSVEDWPTEPIDVTDGVPFLVVRGYRLAGLAETAKDYLKYCRQECVWNEATFKAVDVDAKQAALQKLFTSTKWKQALTDDEKQFLADQIEPRQKKDKQKQQ